MEYFGIKNSIKVKKTIFRLDPKVEKTLKVSRNIDSGLTQVQQIETLIRTLLRLEAIRVGAYERWQPYLNYEHIEFLDLLGYLSVFHNDEKFIENLKRYSNDRARLLGHIKRDRTDAKLYERLRTCMNKGNELMESTREKIYNLQLPQDFRTFNIK